MHGLMTELMLLLLLLRTGTERTDGQTPNASAAVVEIRIIIIMKE